MSKIKILLAILALVVGVQVTTMAVSTANATTSNSLAATVAQSKAARSLLISNELTKRYENNFRTCKPVHLSQNVDWFGLKLDYVFNINGWQNNTCSYDMHGKISSLGSDLRAVLPIPISDQALVKLEPKIKCNFSQEQLYLLVDGFKAMNQDVPTASEKAAAVSNPKVDEMFNMLASSGACVITNQKELQEAITEIMNTPSLISPVNMNYSGGYSSNYGSAPSLRPGTQAKPVVNMPQAPQY